VKAEVAIVGSGVVGASIAYHLARAGAKDILIVDRAATPGQGSTGKATGGFRAQFATTINVRLSLLARDALLRFEDEHEVDPGYRPVGYLWLASSDSEMEAIRASQIVQKAEGLSEVRELSHDDIADINPLIVTDDLIGGSFCPTDGYIRPLQILRGYMQSAARLGARVLWNAECLGMSRDAQGNIAGIATTQGDIDVGTVVNAAGPWAQRIASMADISIPVTPLRRQAAFTEPCPDIPADMPMTIFMSGGFHFRARDGRALICWPNPEEPGEPEQLVTDTTWIDAVTAMARSRVPVLRDVEVDRSLCYAGLYEMSPDDHALLGRMPQCDNLYFANGSSGHGVMHSPAIGSIIADMILGKEPQLDVTELRPSRFDENAPIAATELL
jgi:sarcosine oxidase subunit beta